jgi:hypothetical protein
MKKILLAICLIFAFSGLVIATKEHSGNYLGKYPYTYVYKEGQYIFIFYPTPLPRDDVTVVCAMYEAIEDIDGKHQLIDLKAKIKRNNKGVGIIYFIGKKCTYNFLLMKNANGTVYAFGMWKEPKQR